MYFLVVPLLRELSKCIILFTLQNYLLIIPWLLTIHYYISRILKTHTTKSPIPIKIAQLFKGRSDFLMHYSAETISWWFQRLTTPLYSYPEVSPSSSSLALGPLSAALGYKGEKWSAANANEYQLVVAEQEGCLEYGSPTFEPVVWSRYETRGSWSLLRKLLTEGTGPHRCFLWLAEITRFSGLNAHEHSSFATVTGSPDNLTDMLRTQLTKYQNKFSMYIEYVKFQLIVHAIRKLQFLIIFCLSFFIFNIYSKIYFQSILDFPIRHSRDDILKYCV